MNHKLNPLYQIAIRVMLALAVLLSLGTDTRGDEKLEFFERQVRPILITHCYACHSAEATELAGGLRLDIKKGWQIGGDSGEPAIIPGDPAQSPVLQSILHSEGVSSMPPKQAKLPESVIAVLHKWIADGATDPREEDFEKRDKNKDWEAVFQERLQWWSLKPVVTNTTPNVGSDLGKPQVATSSSEVAQGSINWRRNPIDRFIASELQKRKLSPTPEPDRLTLARRLAFVLTGLPLSPEQLDALVQDDSSDSYDKLVTSLLDSPHFGERWARHWMDVVHYADTHGYEWDVPTKNSWRYRDYLIRAFNADVSYKQLVLEQLAGDLILPRLDPATGINESLIGPLMLRLGERRHGDSAAAEGISQEAVSSMIDTIGKAFLATTLACAQCHDHKLDAVEQRDYYSLAGMLMSSRYSARPLETEDSVVAISNRQTIELLRQKKKEIRSALAERWLQATEPDSPAGAIGVLRAIPTDPNSVNVFPVTLVDFWKRSLSGAVTGESFMQERNRRIAANRDHLILLADFSNEAGAAGWRWEGMGMQEGLAVDGEFAVADEGDVAIMQLLPAGRYSHMWSSRLAGSLQSPQFDPMEPVTFSWQGVAGKFASSTFVVDRALHSERLQFPNLPFAQWQTMTAGNFDSLEGTIDRQPRRVYFELATKSLNNYFPPRVGYGGAGEAELNDPRSWVGVSRIYKHPPAHPPLDELTRFEPLYGALAVESDWGRRLVVLLRRAVERWRDERCDSEDVHLLNDALQNKLLPNHLEKDSQLERLINEYRLIEKKIELEATIGTVADWEEGRNDRLAIRGVYTDFGDEVQRARLRYLQIEGDVSVRNSGRLQWAQRLTDEHGGLLARVYVNRVWHYLFGAGLVRTTDDFGHLGEVPSHPELLDYLAAEFMADGWSTKRLIRRLVTSATWRQGSTADRSAMEIDPENRLWHYMPMRRMEAEVVRDSLLAVSGRLDLALFGPAIEPFRTATDASKRLFVGPLDGMGRRSIYLEMTLMEPPRFLAIFNQPIPKQTVGCRDVTNVPDQALAMLNDPFVIEMARHWGSLVINDGSVSVGQRAERMIRRAFAREPRPEEITSLVFYATRIAQQRQVEQDLLKQPGVWQDVAHAIFNLKEFIYVP
jgi:hypothetical protein